MEQLTEQVQRLKKEFEDKAAAPITLKEEKDSSSYMRNLEEEIRAKDELIEDANRFIEEFNDEKHEIKSKFKHLMQVLDDPSILPEDESEYKEEDEIDLNECFDRFEKEVIRVKKRVDSRIQGAEEEAARAKADLER